MSDSGQGAEQRPEQGGRYTRGFNGMVGAMIFIVGLVLLLVLFRTLISDPPEEGRPPAVDYLDSVLGLQQNDFDVVYPETLPEGWVVTEVRADLGEEAQSYRINVYTDDDQFIGIRQQDAATIELDALLEQYVDEDTRSEDPLTGVGDLAPTWEGFSDSGGDRAYTAEVGGDVVLVFGDVSTEELTTLVASLGTTDLTGTS